MRLLGFLKKRVPVLMSPIALGLFILIPGIRLKTIYSRFYGSVVESLAAAPQIPDSDLSTRLGFPESPVSDPDRDVAVLFSGGSDSTLLAAVMAGSFRRVHLITVIHPGMTKVYNGKGSVERLQKRFGRERIIHKYIDGRKLFRKFLLSDYFSDLKSFGMSRFAACNACRAMIYYGSLIYCLQNGIRYISEGFTDEVLDWDFFGETFFSAFRGMYARHGVTYIVNPCIGLKRPDLILQRNGIVPLANMNRERVEGINKKFYRDMSSEIVGNGSRYARVLKQPYGLA
jgi:hypothetical protein